MAAILTRTGGDGNSNLEPVLTVIGRIEALPQSL